MVKGSSVAAGVDTPVDTSTWYRLHCHAQCVAGILFIARAAFLEQPLLLDWLSPLLLESLYLMWEVVLTITFPIDIDGGAVQ